MTPVEVVRDLERQVAAFPNMYLSPEQMNALETIVGAQIYSVGYYTERRRSGLGYVYRFRVETARRLLDMVALALAQQVAEKLVGPA